MTFAFEDFFKKTVCSYPSLYANNDIRVSKMKVLDQLLNTVGNGIRDDEELIEYLNEYKKIGSSDFDRYLTEKTYTGYTRLEEPFEPGEKQYPDINSVVSYGTLENDRYKYPEVILWRKNRINGFTPYPNFQEEYSLVYTCPVFFSLGKDWIEAAIFFYTACQQWFVNNEKSYHYAFPTNNKKADERLVKELEETFKKYDSFEAISLDYNTQYNGDVPKFLVLRWEKELTRINSFLFKTIEYLSTK